MSEFKPCNSRHWKLILNFPNFLTVSENITSFIKQTFHVFNIKFPEEIRNETRIILNQECRSCIKLNECFYTFLFSYSLVRQSNRLIKSMNKDSFPPIFRYFIHTKEQFLCRTKILYRLSCVSCSVCPKRVYCLSSRDRQIDSSYSFPWMIYWMVFTDSI